MPNIKRTKKYLSAPQAAKVLGVSRIAVLKRIYRGTLPAMKIGRNYAIRQEDLTM